MVRNEQRDDKQKLLHILNFFVVDSWLFTSAMKWGSGWLIRTHQITVIYSIQIQFIITDVKTNTELIYRKGDEQQNSEVGGGTLIGQTVLRETDNAYLNWKRSLP